MSKHKSNPSSDSRQLSLFEPQFNDRIRRQSHEGIEYFSLVDMMAEFSDTESEAKYYWRDTKARLMSDGFQSWDKISQLKMKSNKDGKSYKTDCADGATCLRIIQSIPSVKAEPIRRWLASLGYERLEEHDNAVLTISNAHDRAASIYARQGKQESWIDTRLKSIDANKRLRDALRDTHPISKPEYAKLFGTENRIILGASKAEIILELGLTSAQANRFRDHLGELALKALEGAEIAARMKIAQLGRMLTDDEQMAVVCECSRLVAPAFWALAEYSETDFVTGQPKLSSGLS